MKKILLFSIAIIICFVVCVCGKDENANTYTMRFYIVYENQSSEILRGENEQNQLARNYVYVMTESSNLMGLVAENCDYEVEMTAEFVREKIDYEIDEDNGDIIISITTDNSELSYAIAKSYSENYAEITDDIYQNTDVVIKVPVK